MIHGLKTLAFFSLLIFTLQVTAQNTDRGETAEPPPNRVSPVRRIEGRPNRPDRSQPGDRTEQANTNGQTQGQAQSRGDRPQGGGDQNGQPPQNGGGQNGGPPQGGGGQDGGGQNGGDQNGGPGQGGGGQDGGGQNGGGEPNTDPQFRSMDGTDNNPNNPLIGSTFTQLMRLAPANYGDGISSLANPNGPNPREISNVLCAQTASKPNGVGASDFLWQWGQFLDHDIDLTDGMNPPEEAPIAIPTGDRFFDPSRSGTAVMNFNRSLYDENTGSEAGNPRQQLNEITAWIDASNVYGSSVERASALRTNDGTGRLKTSEGGFLPFNTEGLPNAGGPGAELFLAGDVRANEQVGLATMHTLFVREHNRQAQRIADQNPTYNGEQIYQRARRIVGAQMQVITYREFLPTLLGPNAIPPYQGYDPTIDAGIANEFSSAVYRFGHSTLNSTLLRLDAGGTEIEEGHLALRDAFFRPDRVLAVGLEPVLRGLASQACQDMDTQLIDDVRNFLFGPPGSGGFDLASLNIQRGRDHGLGTYNQTRRAYGLQPARTFNDISANPDVQRGLAQVYDNVNQVDLWVGCLSEDHLPGAMVGELAAAVIGDQFQALRDGDRFWYTRQLTANERREVENTTLADIIRRNTNIGGEITDDVFHVGN